MIRTVENPDGSRTYRAGPSRVLTAIAAALVVTALGLLALAAKATRTAQTHHGLAGSSNLGLAAFCLGLSGFGIYWAVKILTSRRVTVTSEGLTAHNLAGPRIRRADATAIATIDVRPRGHHHTPATVPFVTRTDGTGFFLDALSAHPTGRDQQDSILDELRSHLAVPVG